MPSLSQAAYLRDGNAVALRAERTLAQCQHHGGALATNDWDRLLLELFCGPFVLDVFAVGDGAYATHGKSSAT